MNFIYRHVLLFIGIRYIYKKTADCFVNFLSWLSILGITLGVTALIVVLSVMNGFESEIQNNILELMPQVILSSTYGSINPQIISKNTIKLQNVIRIAQLTTSDVIIQSINNIATGIMLGVEPSQKDPLFSYLINTKQADLLSGKYNIILGKQLAYRLGVVRGDQIRLIIPSVNQFTPIGRLPVSRLFNVIGTFCSNSEVDSYQLLINIQDASRLMYSLEDNITGWRLWLKEPLKVNELNKQKLPEGIIIWQDWRKYKGDLFQGIRIEKNMMGLLLSLIVIVAALNIISSLSLIVTEKQSEIAILQTQGLMPYQIMMIFVMQGTSIGTIGTLLGVLLGILCTSQLNHLRLITNTVFDSITIPVAIEPLQIIIIMLITIILTLLFAIYPSWCATKIQPAKILRYE